MFGQTANEVAAFFCAVYVFSQGINQKSRGINV